MTSAGGPGPEVVDGRSRVPDLLRFLAGRGGSARVEAYQQEDPDPVTIIEALKGGLVVTTLDWMDWAWRDDEMEPRGLFRPCLLSLTEKGRTALIADEVEP